jgi:hypothetical protein
LAQPGSNGHPVGYRKKSTVPIVKHRVKDDSYWAGVAKLKASESSPLFDVEHELVVSLSFLYTCSESEKKLPSKLKFSIPVRFVNPTPPPSPPNPFPCQRGVGQSNSSLMLLESHLDSTDIPPPPRNLPAYSQLFDSTGERLIDYSTPLPLYSPPAASSTLDTSIPEVKTVPSED